MTSRGRRSRIARFAQPFIVGALGTVALTSGCGAKSTADEGCEEGCSQPIQTSCPNVTPKAGDECSGLEGLRCGDDEPCSEVGEFRCSDEGVWQDVSPLCHPLPRPIDCDDEPCPNPGKACPEEPPNVGDDCVGSEGLVCEQADPCDGEFQCSAEGVWQHFSAPACNPPPLFNDECPGSIPELGTSCGEFTPGLNCSYGDEPCPPVRICGGSGNWEGTQCGVECPASIQGGETCAGFGGMTCGVDVFNQFLCAEDGHWLDVSAPSNPPPVVDCPTALPELGANCGDFGACLTCVYPEHEGSPVRVCVDGGNWESEPGACAGPPPPSLCPPELPEIGSACEALAAGTECEYATDSETCSQIVGCTDDGLWESRTPPCDPPPPEDLPCPVQEPTAGEACDGVAPLLVCSYGSACDAQFVCANDGVWIDSTPICNPPYIEDAGGPLPVDTASDAGDAGDGG